jgi:hypothetical protein
LDSYENEVFIQMLLDVFYDNDDKKQLYFLFFCELFYNTTFSRYDFVFKKKLQHSLNNEIFVVLNIIYCQIRETLRASIKRFLEDEFQKVFVTIFGPEKVNSSNGFEPSNLIHNNENDNDNENNENNKIRDKKENDNENMIQEPRKWSTFLNSLW